jgi:hypothetical protein
VLRQKPSFLGRSALLLCGNQADIRQMNAGFERQYRRRHAAHRLVSVAVHSQDCSTTLLRHDSGTKAKLLNRHDRLSHLRVNRPVRAAEIVESCLCSIMIAA